MISMCCGPHIFEDKNLIIAVTSPFDCKLLENTSQAQKYSYRELSNLVDFVEVILGVSSLY